MKKFFEVVVSVKERTGLIYTGSMFFYMFFLWVFRQDSAPLTILFSLLLVSVAASVMQMVAFSDLVIKRLAYGWRLVVFVVPFGAILTAFAVGCGWFPTDQLGAWVLFGVFFVLIFVAITGGIELYYRLSGRKWDDRLDWYRKNREKE